MGHVRACEGGKAPGSERPVPQLPRLDPGVSSRPEVPVLPREATRGHLSLRGVQARGGARRPCLQLRTGPGNPLPLAGRALARIPRRARPDR